MRRLEHPADEVAVWEDEVDIHVVRVEYDVGRVARAIRDSDLPSEFADQLESGVTAST